MTNKMIRLSALFIVISGTIVLVGTYLFVTPDVFVTDSFITTCGALLSDLRNHIRLTPTMVSWSVISLLMLTGIGFACLRTIRFIISVRQLSRRETETDRLPEKLISVLAGHDIDPDTLRIVRQTRLTAYTRGLLHPRIVISSSLIRRATKHQLEAIILHELYHARHRHLVGLMVTRIVSGLLFFIPFISYLARRIETEFEMAADAFVVRKQLTRDHLCDVLALNIRTAPHAASYFAASPIEQRVDALVSENVRPENLSLRHLSISMLSILMIAGLTISRPVQDHVAPSGPGTACLVTQGCPEASPDCLDHQKSRIPTSISTPITPASFPFSTAG